MIGQQKLCANCLVINEIDELKKILKDRVFDASNEGEITMENLEMSFNNEMGRKKMTQN